MSSKFFSIKTEAHNRMRQLKISKSITNRDSPALDRYLQDIGQADLITPEEEVELARRIKKGDTAAYNRLVEANLRFVVSVAKQYPNQGLSLADLINEGNVGLMKAAHRFDDSFGFKFISYAVWWIRQSIQQAISETGRLVRLPINQAGTISKVNRFFNSFEQENERKPSPEEVAEFFHISTDRLNETMRLNTRPLSVDAPLTDSDDTCMLDTMIESDSAPVDKELVEESLKCEINRVVGKLPQREAQVVKMFYGIGCDELSLDEISMEIGLSRERVRQIKERAIRMLRISNNKLLKTYLG